MQAAAACQEAAQDITADCPADGSSGQGFPVGFPASFPAANAFARLPLLSTNGYGWPMQACPGCMHVAGRVVAAACAPGTPQLSALAVMATDGWNEVDTDCGMGSL